MNVRRILPWAALVVVVLGALVWAGRPAGDGSSVSARVNRVTRELRCPECSGLSVADSSSTTAEATRVDVRQRIEDGESDAEIRRAYVELYGDSILLKPEGRGISAVVWVLPVVLLVVGGAGIVLALRRWRRQPRLAATDADRELVDRARSSGPVGRRAMAAR